MPKLLSSGSENGAKDSALAICFQLPLARHNVDTDISG